MRKVYVKPEMEMSFFEDLDVITTSGGSEDEGNESYSMRSFSGEEDTEQIDSLPEIVQPTTEADPVATTEASTEEVETTTEASTEEVEATTAIVQDDDTFGTDN